MSRGWSGSGIAGIVLSCLMGAGACSQGAPSDPFPGLPPVGPGAPQTSTGDTGPVTFGMGDDRGECCIANGTPGCNDPTVETCVCRDVSECCDVEWTSECAELADRGGCAVCAPGVPDTGTDPDESGIPPVDQDCCVGGPEPGCNDLAIQACVCDKVDYCCMNAWDEVCISAVEAFSCSDCGGGSTGEPPGGSTGGEPPPPPPMGECCQPQMGPGCNDPVVQNCVCAQDPFCCDDIWDDVCVDQVDEFMCGSCMPGGPSCCQAHAGSGCVDPDIQSCVCLIDDFCCNVLWDETCTILASICGGCS
ncbi:MAG: hypothetical protein AAGF11_44970 [Myxococcota bacterium]